jgi:ABC-type lipoprotein release transport system permease subunit
MFMSLKLGVRNLRRNRWRSGLTLAAIGVAVALMVWMLALYEGWIDEMVRGTTSIETGQVQVHTAAHIQNPRIYETLPGDPELLARIAAVPGVVAVAPRVRAFGLLGNEQRSQVARVVGVDPQGEAAATPVVRAVVEGRWLSPLPAAPSEPREVVLGQGVAQQLRVGVGAELVVFLEAADGSLGNELLEVVGVVRTANMQVDRLTAYLHLQDAQFIVALEDEVHELMVGAADMQGARELAVAVAGAIGGVAGAPEEGSVDGGTLVARPWQEITPALHQAILLFRSSYGILYALIYLIAAIGIVNTARMSALERRREFGVMLAIGMRPRRMLRTLLGETAVLGFAGALLGAALGLAISWYFVVNGFDVGIFTDEGSFSFMGVAFSERLPFVIRPANVIRPIIIMLVVAVLSGLWPAYRAARIDPAPTIAGRT